MSLTANKVGPYFSSGSISFSQLRTNFKEKSTGEVKASELLRVTDTTNIDPIVPDATENSEIATSSNLKTSQFRNSIKYYNLNQGGGDTDLNLNISDSTLWNGNLGKTIVKTVTLAGTTGSTNSNAAASLDASAVYNVLLIITGSIQGTGGSAGTETVNGGDGGDAIYINTNSTGTVTIRTSGGGAQVYGGGGGGGGGGDGGTGGGGQYTQSGSSYWANTVCSGNGMPCYTLNPPFPCNCENECRRIRSCGDGINYTLWERKCRYCYSNTYYTNGGAGGDAKNGGLGQGYSQTRTLGVNGDSGSNGGTNAGRGGTGGTSGTGGNWGENGTDGNTGNTGNNGNRTSGLAGNNGTLGGTAGRAVAGSGYVIDTGNGVESAYIGLK
jgi:hypothetical protein